jgi:hypothetical protein
MSKPKAIESPEELESLFQAFKKWSEEHPFKEHDFVGKDGNSVERKKKRAISWIGFEGYLADNGIVCHLGHYEQNKDGAYDAYLPTIRAIKKRCAADVIGGALAGIYHGNLAARIEGLADKKELEAQVNVTPITGMEIK